MNRLLAGHILNGASIRLKQYGDMYHVEVYVRKVLKVAYIHKNAAVAYARYAEAKTMLLNAVNDSIIDTVELIKESILRD